MSTLRAAALGWQSQKGGFPIKFSRGGGKPELLSEPREVSATRAISTTTARASSLAERAGSRL